MLRITKSHRLGGCGFKESISKNLTVALSSAFGAAIGHQQSDCFRELPEVVVRVMCLAYKINKAFYSGCQTHHNEVEYRRIDYRLPEQKADD